jgi:tetratricopeptide (TPR) repeat protein
MIPKIQTPQNYILLVLLSSIFVSAQNPNQGRGLNGNEKEYLFPGTGFFVKNRKPYDDIEAKNWFQEAFEYQKKGSLSKSLKLYEKFSRRRSDASVDIDGKNFEVGPESLYRAAQIREDNGDWSKSFEYLKLIAQAYTNYDFELVAESLMRVSEKLAKDKLPRKWGIIPRFRSGTQDRSRLNQIAGLARGPRFAPRALMALAEISIKDDKNEEAVDALDRLVNLYPENFLCEKAYFLLATIYKNKVAGPSYDQGATLKALNFFEDYLILFADAPPQSPHENSAVFEVRLADTKIRKIAAEAGRKEMRQVLASSKVEVGEYIEKFGKFYLTRWKELGNQPAIQFYNEAITTAPESTAAREAEKKIANLRSEND